MSSGSQGNHPATPAGGTAPTGTATATAAAASIGPGGVRLDAATQEKIRAAQEIGEAAFEENTQIIRRLLARGLRSFFVAGFGALAFGYAMRKKRREQEALAEKSAADNPTERYLEEMRSLGFDVDTLEEDLEQQRKRRLQSELTNRPR